MIALRRDIILVYVGTIILSWKILWYILYKLTGVHLRSIGINNGISLNGITIKTQTTELRLKKLRFRLWSNTRKIILDDLEITKIGGKKKKGSGRTEDHKDSLDLRLNALPRNWFGKILVRFLIQHAPKIDIELRRTTIRHSGSFAHTFEYLNLVAWSRQSKRYDTRIKFYFSLWVTNLVQTFTDTGSKLDTDPINISNAKFCLNLSVDLSTGEFHRVSQKLFIGEFKISIYSSIKLFLSKLKRSENGENGVRDSPKANESRNQAILERIHKMRRFAKLITDFSIQLENASIFEIPFATTEDNESFSTYFKATKPLRSLTLEVKSVILNFQKLFKTAAGFAVLFDAQKDIPFHITSSLQLLTLKYTILSKDSGNYQVKSTDELLNLPNLSFTNKANILYQLIQGNGFKDCVMEFYASASSPILDLDSSQLCELIYNIVLLKKYLKLRRLKSNTEVVNKGPIDSDSDELEDTKIDFDSNDNSSSFDSIWNLLNEYYPKLDVKLVIEQTRFIVNHTIGKKTEILQFSYALLDFQISTTESRNYDAKCHVLNPVVLYQEISDFKKITKNEVFSIKSAVFSFNILKNLKVDSKLDINEIHFNLSQLGPLIGINNMLEGIAARAENDLSIGKINLDLNSCIFKELQERIDNLRLTHNSNQSGHILFSYLPSWLLQIKVNISFIKVLFGSGSILIPKDLVSREHLKEFESNTQNLRVVQFSADEIKFTIRGDFQDETTLVSSNSSSETLASENNTFNYWSITSVTSKFNISMRLNPMQPNQKFDSFLSIPVFEMGINALSSNEGNNLIIDLDFDQLIGKYDRYKLFAIVGSIYLIREFILSPIASYKKNFKDDFKRVSLKQSFPKHSESIIKFLSINLILKQLGFTFYLNDQFKIKLQIFDVMISLLKGDITLNSKFLRLLVDSPIVKNQWNRILCADALSVSADEASNYSKISIMSDSIRFIHPHQLLAHKLFDNLSITIKIAKYLTTCLKNSDSQTRSIVNPKESKCVKLPSISLKSRKMGFCMEDDPFESNLNMIYQLGFVEQRKRIELYSLLESRSDSKDIKSNDVKLEMLNKEISRSWIRKVKSYKSKVADEIESNKRFLFGNEINIDKKSNKGITSYMNQPPLLSVWMNSVDLDLSKPQFDISEVPDFINRFGQGVPIDTKYSTLVPMFISLNISELRMHLRDYPLPLLHIPKNEDNQFPSLNMSGHFIISEALPHEEKSTRSLHMPLIMSNIKERDEKYFSLKINKSLAPVKLYMDLNCKFDASKSSRFVWGQSYQFGIQQVMLNLDQFSKPPIDPSKKLGIWDKIRMIIHGKFKVESSNKLEVAFKGSRDPYDLFDNSSGFVLAFKDNIIWKINENDDPKLFFDVKSEKVAWYIPNYLATPLFSWSRDSSSFTYLPSSKSFIFSCFGYYLQESGHLEENISSGIIEKNVINLSGGVNFKVGFVLQRKNNEGVITNESKPHFSVSLCNPKFASEGHDSYSGFRSDYVHMAISLEANTESSYNAIYLSPGAFKQFFGWWKLFSGNMQLPIRQGRMFGEHKESVKFSQHLVSNKFQFRIRSLFISHVYRDKADEFKNKIECNGLRGKMDEFLVDLHQRREPRIAIHEELSRNKRIKKMNFHIGEVHLSGIDLRAVNANFESNVYSLKPLEYNDKDSKYHIFDNDIQWFDIKDYEDTFLPSLATCKRTVIISPLLFSNRFSYLRDTSRDSAQSFGEQESEVFGGNGTHQCTLFSKNIFAPQIKMYEDRIEVLENQIKLNEKKNISTSQLRERIIFLKNSILDTQKKWRSMARRPSTASDNTSKEHFHNRFILIGMYLKWNVKNRNILLKYIHFVKLKQFMRKFLSYESVSTIEDIITTTEAFDCDDLSSMSKIMKRKSSELSDKKVHSSSYSEDRINNFESILREVSENEKIVEDYMIEIISPQIQLQSDVSPDSVVVIAAPNIDAKIISVIENSKNEHLLLNFKELENRYGVILRDANIFVLKKDDVAKSNKLILDKVAYGSSSNWPPWLGIEICRNGIIAGTQTLLVEKTSIMLTFDSLNPLGSNMSTLNGVESSDSCSSGTENDSEQMKVMNRLQVDVPKFVIKSTSTQYFSLYVIVLNLLFYTEPMSKSLTEKLEKLRLSIDFQDLASLHQRMTALHQYYELITKLIQNYNFRKEFLDNESLNEYLMLSMEQENTSSEIYLLMQSILTGDFYQESSDSAPKTEWFIRADQIILHMLDDDRSPLIDIAIAQGKFKRSINENGSNDNRIDIKMIQGFNLIPRANFKSLIEPFNDPRKDENDESLITVDWSMHRSVGGIKLMENFEIKSKPLKIKIDEKTGEKLIKYIFHASSDSLDESPLLKSTANLLESQSGKSDQEDEDCNSVSDNDNDRSSVSNKSCKSTSESIDRLSKNNVGSISHQASQSFHTGSSRIENKEHVDEMLARSNKYMSIVSLKVSRLYLSISICLSKGFKRVLNVQDFGVHLPAMFIENKVMSLLDITMLFKKLVIKALLSHSARLILNKMIIKKRGARRIVEMPLRPLKRYDRFIKVSDFVAGTDDQ